MTCMIPCPLLKHRLQKIDPLMAALSISLAAHIGVFAGSALFNREPDLSEYQIVQLVNVDQPSGGHRRAAPASRPVTAPAPKTDDIVDNPHGAEQPSSAQEPSAGDSSSTDDGGWGNGDFGSYLPFFKVTRLPEPLTRIQPVYPARAKLTHTETEVIAEVYIDTQGRSRKAVVVRSGGQEFDDSVIAALKAARFLPALDRNGKPVPVRVRIPFKFELE